MPDPVSLTVGAIASLAFQEFIKSGSGELAKKFTAEAIAKMNALRELILKRFQGNADALHAVESVKQGSEEDLNDVATYLKAAMKHDPEFSAQVQAIAQEINAGKLQDNSSMSQNNYDNARGWQTKVEGGTAYIGEINQYGSNPPPKA